MVACGEGALFFQVIYILREIEFMVFSIIFGGISKICPFFLAISMNYEIFSLSIYVRSPNIIVLKHTNCKTTYKYLPVSLLIFIELKERVRVRVTGKKPSFK